MPLFGLGCAGGAGALSMAADYLRARPQGVAVVLSVELCSLTWSLEETTKTTLVGIALFADGAGCAVMTGGDRGCPGAQVLDTRTELFPETADLMGWDFSDRGFGLVLSPNVPGRARKGAPAPPNIQDIPSARAAWSQGCIRRAKRRIVPSVNGPISDRLKRAIVGTL